MAHKREEKSKVQDAQVTDDQQMKETVKTSGKPLRKRLWLWLCGSCVLLLLFVVFALPMGVKYYLVDWLQKRGADQVIIDRFGWNPFLGKLWLEGVDVSRDGRSLMTQRALDIDIDFFALFDKDIALSSASYTGLTLEVEQKEDNSWQIATLTFPLPEESGNKETPPATREKAPAMQGNNTDVRQQVSTAWAFLADNVVLTNCQIHYKTPVFDFIVHVDSAELKRFSTRQGSPAGSLLLNGSVNGEQITIDLAELQISPTLRLAGKVAVNRFDIDSLDTLLQDSLPFFAGDASGKGNIDFSFDDTGLAVTYDGNIAVSKADVGAESFRTQADNLRWQGKIRYEMPKEKPMLVVTDGLLHGESYSLQVPGAGLATSEKQVKLSGTTKVTIGNGVQVDHSGELSVAAIACTLPILQTTEDSLRWNGHVYYDLAQKHLVEATGKLNVTKVDYTMPGQSLHINEENIVWQGNLRYQGKNGQKNNDVQMDGKLAFAPANVVRGREKEKISTAIKTLGWEGVFSFYQPETGGNYIETDSSLSGEEIEVILYGKNLSFSEENLHLDSRTTLQFGETFNMTSLSSLTTGSFTLQQLNAKEPVLSLDNLVITRFAGLGGKTMRADSITADNLHIKTAGAFPLHIQVPVIRSNEFFTSDLETFLLASLSLSKPEIVSLQNGKDLLTLDDITLTNLETEVTGDITAGADITLHNLIFLGEQEGQSSIDLKQARLSDFHWSEDGGIVGKDLDFHNLAAAIIRDTQGKMDIVTRLSAMQDHGDTNTTQKTVSQQTDTAANEPSQLKLKLAKVHISGDSSIDFKDYTRTVPYQTSLEIDELEITDIDSTQPDKKSLIALSGTLEKRAPITVEGGIWPFSRDIGLDLSLKLKNYPLQNLSSYTIDSLGVGLASGELQIESSALLKDTYLKNTNQILLRKLETKMVSDELAEELNKRLPVPLDTALSLLRDKNGAIKLSVPLTGNVDTLHVGLADVIITALGKAVVPALTGYAIYALGPYGALAYAGVKLGENLLKEKDLPLIFMKGESILVTEQKEVLAPLGQEMQTGEQEDLQICPIVASWELLSKEEIDAVSGDKVPLSSLTPEIQQQLELLGQKRAENIQNYFMQQFNIQKNRLLLCTTVIKEEKKFLPLVALRRE